MSEPICTCPRSIALGYRFHRYPCSRAGDIEDLTAAQSESAPTPESKDEQS